MVHSSCSRGISALAAIGRARVPFLLLVLISAVACPAWGQTNPVPVLKTASPSQALAGATASLTLTGTGFVSGTVILVNGAAVPTTYQSATSVVAQVTAPAGSSASLPVQAQNPSPGGGTSATLQIPVATLQMTATDPDGTNTGTARLGIPVSFSATTTDTAHTSVSWTVQGGGTIGSGGAYTPPQTMPSIPTVTVTAYLTNLPALTTSYTFTLINPVPVLSAASPTQAVAGGTVPITLTGTGLVSGTVILVNGVAAPTTYQSPTSVVAQIAAPAGSGTSLSVQAQDPSPGGGTGGTFQLPVATLQITATDPDGTNTGTARLGVPVSFSTTTTDTAHTAVTWTVQGAGTIGAGGTYTPPQTMPSSPTVTVTAYLTNVPALTTSYTFTLINSAPVLSSSSPSQALAGATASLTLTGAGFVSGTAILVNGVAVPTTYQSPTSVVAQITAPAGASGSLPVQAQNPSPGGGTSATLQVPIATLQLTAADPDGTNTGTARLGVPVTFSAANTDTSHATIAWSVQGSGTIAASGTNNATGTYTPPVTMPSSSAVTVTAYLSSLPALTTSYILNLINPVPTVTSTTPAQALTGGTGTVTLVGSGFVPGTIVTLNGTSYPITYVSYTKATVQLPVAANATGTLTLQVQNPAPGGGGPVSYSLPIATDSIVVAPTSQTGPVVALGGGLTMGATVSGSVSTAVTWSVSGGGTISSTGTYTAPITMPTGSVVITAALTSNPSVTASYPLTLTNPVPTVLSIPSPSQALAGAMTSLTLIGRGFVSGTVILVNGVAVPTTYQSATSVVAQVTTAAGASGSLSVQAQNPSPGGGTGPTFQVLIATLTVTAADPDGTNTGTARLGIPVTFSAANTDTNHSTIAWSVQGGGTIAASGTNNATGTYTPPVAMPSSSAVTVTAYLASLPALTTSYTLNLINPVPTVTSTTPAQLQTGGTQTVTLVGSGFVPGTTVTLNGTSYPITCISYTNATVQLPIAANATGTLTLQVQNPAPGGGAGTTFTESVAPASITLTATGEDGINTGYADLDFTVAMSASISGSMQSAVNWSVVGAGSISNSGVYTPPVAIPSNPVATIYATLASNPAITAAYPVNIVNPMPVLTSASPTIVAAVTTTSVSLTGTGFVPSTVIEVNGTAVPTTYVSPTSVTAQVTPVATATGSLSLQAYTPTPNGGLSDLVDLAISAPISETAAARLLDQTTFGPTTSLIQHVQSEGVTAWLTEQYNTPQTVLPLIPAVPPSYAGSSNAMVRSEWWQTAITGNDQLRQRVAFALSELFVISTDTIIGWDMQSYMNTLAQDAFSNWYTIMNDVTLSPGMGNYLNMVNSLAPTATMIANENYARENMQLFNLGLNLLNQDGSLQLDGNNNPIPTYTEAQVQAFARVYTGWTYANADGSTPSVFTTTPNYYHPMVAVEMHHDENPKTLLNGTVLPAGQTAEQDLAGALNNIFQHPNVPPFVCRQLIQHLVKSDPGPEYISRCAAVFTNDGNGVRGDMQAVLTEILTDFQARAGDNGPQPSDGHLREPILWLTDVMRGLGYVNVDPNDYWDNLSTRALALAERPFQAPAVFNFFPPSYVIPGTTLNAPEFGLENTASVADRLTLADGVVSNTIGSFNVDLSATSPLGQILVAQGPAALVNALSNLFLCGTMDSNTATAITNEISTMTNPAQQVEAATYLVITSPEYLVLH